MMTRLGLSMKNTSTYLKDEKNDGGKIPSNRHGYNMAQISIDQGLQTPSSDNMLEREHVPAWA